MATVTRSSLPTPLRTAAANSRALARVVYIFQLPATNFLRMGIGLSGPSNRRSCSTRVIATWRARPPAKWDRSRDRLADHLGEAPQLLHQGRVLVRQERLRAVRQRLLGAVVHLHVH